MNRCWIQSKGCELAGDENQQEPTKGRMEGNKQQKNKRRPPTTQITKPQHKRNLTSKSFCKKCNGETTFPLTLSTSCSPHSSIQVIPNNFSTSEHADISRLQATHGARRSIVILSPTVIQMLVATATCQQNFGRPVTDINSAKALRLNTSLKLLVDTPRIFIS